MLTCFSLLLWKIYRWSDIFQPHCNILSKQYLNSWFHHHDHHWHLRQVFQRLRNNEETTSSFIICFCLFMGSVLEDDSTSKNKDLRKKHVKILDSATATLVPEGASEAKSCNFVASWTWFVLTKLPIGPVDSEKTPWRVENPKKKHDMFDSAVVVWRVYRRCGLESIPWFISYVHHLQLISYYFHSAKPSLKLAARTWKSTPETRDSYWKNHYF